MVYGCLNNDKGKTQQHKGYEQQRAEGDIILIVLRVGSCRNQIPYGRVIYAHKSLFRREFGFYRILRGINKKGPQEQEITMELTTAVRNEMLLL